MIRRTTLLLVLAFFPVMVFGQLQEDKNRAGSTYSSIAFGEPVSLYSPSGAGMGLTGVSMYDPYAVNSANPGLWGVNSHTQGVLTVDMHRLRVEDGAETGITNRIGINRFQLVLPIVRSQLGLSAGFLPVTRSSYSLRASGSFTPDFEEVDYTTLEAGAGGVNRAELGLGYRLSDYFSIGYSANVYFASLNREHDLEFDNVRYQPLSYNEDFSGTGLGHRFGLFARTSGLLRENDESSFGISLLLPVEIDMDRSVTGFRNVSGGVQEVDLLPSSGLREGQIDLPLEINLGLTYNPSRFVSLSAEYFRQQWSDASYTFNTNEEQFLVDRSKSGVGAQFHPYRGDSGGFFSSFKYSLGAGYDTGYLKMAGERVETLMVNGGIGILSQRSASSIDIGFQLGFRGMGTQNLIKETVWGLTLSINLAEMMFIPPMFQ